MHHRGTREDSRRQAEAMARDAEAAGGDEQGRALDRSLPVPLRHRHDGWTRARQERFLARLAETGCVRDACALVGLSSTSAYRAYARMPAFALCWDRALSVRKPMLEDAAFERAVNGVTVPLTRLGKQVGERRRYSDGLLRYLLERADKAVPGMAGAGRWVTPASQAEVDAALMERLTKLHYSLEQEKIRDPEGAARREAEDRAALRRLVARHEAAKGAGQGPGLPRHPDLEPG